jgi:PAS domain S-box-containing protein
MALPLLIIAALVAVDVATPNVVVLGLLIAAPLLAGLTATPRQTRIVAIIAVAVAAASFIWDDSVDSWRFWIRLAVVTIGSSFAVLMADYRRRATRDARRMQVLADLADVAYAGKEVGPLAQDICDLLVPRLVAHCAIDRLGGDGQVQRLASAGDAADVESTVAIALKAREHAIGSLTLAGRSYVETPDFQEYAETLAGRVSLALDNAVLSEELTTTEAQLETILGSVDAAITVRDFHGRMVYANQAAAELLGLPDPAAVKAEPPGILMERFDVYTEDGDPVVLEDLPGTRLLGGEPNPEPVVVRNVVRATGEERWLLNRATAVTASDGRTLMAVNLIEDITETKRSELAQRLLARTAREVAEASDLSRTLQAIADAAVPGLADWAGVELLDGSGRLEAVAIAHRDPEKVQLGWTLRRRWPSDPDTSEGLAAVVRTGQPQVISEITDEMLVAGARDPEHLAILREVGLNSTMFVPIRAGARILGTLSFVSSTARRFDKRDLELASDLGRQAGIFINNAQLHAEQAHIAHTLQAGLIPDRIPPLDGWRVSTAYRAAGRANEVGGDFYDVVAFEGGWAAIIGDVVGKGAEAAALTALARHTLAAIIEFTGDAARALTVLNARLRERGAGDFSGMCTIAIVTVTGGDRATIHSAGHPLPVLIRAGGSSFVGQTGRLLGVFDDIRPQGTRLDLVEGDQLLLYTDGVLDAVGADERFGEARLLRVAQDLGEERPALDLITAVEGFSVGDQSDDIAILSLTRVAVGAERAAA